MIIDWRKMDPHRPAECYDATGARTPRFTCAVDTETGVVTHWKLLPNGGFALDENHKLQAVTTQMVAPIKVRWADPVEEMFERFRQLGKEKAAKVNEIAMEALANVTKDTSKTTIKLVFECPIDDSLDEAKRDICLAASDIAAIDDMWMLPVDDMLRIEIPISPEVLADIKPALAASVLTRK